MGAPVLAYGIAIGRETAQNRAAQSAAAQDFDPVGASLGVDADPVGERASDIDEDAPDGGAHSSQLAEEARAPARTSRREASTPPAFSPLGVTSVPYTLV